MPLAATVTNDFGYARIPASAAARARGHDSPAAAVCDHVIVDPTAGRLEDCPGLTNMLKQLEAGDTLVVWGLERLGDPLRHLIDVVGALQRNGISLRSVEHSLDLHQREGRLRFEVLGRQVGSLFQPRVFGGLEVDALAREARVDGVDIRLTKIEFDILDALSTNPRRTLTREELLIAVWGDLCTDKHVIEVHVGKLRKKLGESATRPHYIRTLRGVGYRFEPT